MTFQLWRNIYTNQTFFLLVCIKKKSRGGYSRKFMCRQGSWTLTLFKDKGIEKWYPIYGPNPKNDTLFKGSKQQLKRPAKHKSL